MHKNKDLFGITIIFLIVIFMISIVSAVKPITNIQVSEGYVIDVTSKSAIAQNTDHEFEVHVFNISNGMPITSGISCYMHLYGIDGGHLYVGFDDTVSHDFDYSFDIAGGNFSELGEYEAKFQCNSSRLGGGQQVFFIVNAYGEELTTADTLTFNFSMMFMLVLFLMAVVGIITVQNPVGKFACYWIAHLFFVVGTFSVWQFNMGYAVAYIGLAGVWKWLFYFSAFAMLPLMILSIAGMIIYFATERKVMRLIDHGMSEQEARRRVR